MSHPRDHHFIGCSGSGYNFIDRYSAELNLTDTQCMVAFSVQFLIRHPDPFKEIRAAVYDHWRRPDDVTETEYESLRGPDDRRSFRIGLTFKETI